jgi:hypothetical protein
LSAFLTFNFEHVMIHHSVLALSAREC